MRVKGRSGGGGVTRGEDGDRSMDRGFVVGMGRWLAGRERSKGWSQARGR